MSKQIEYELDARKKLRAGVDSLAKSVVITLGPRGRNVVLEKMDGSPQMSCNRVPSWRWCRLLARNDKA